MTTPKEPQFPQIEIKKVIYVETSIPSFYHESRTEPAMVARKEWTNQWWNNFRHHYTLVTSEAVLEELNRGSYPNKDKVIALLAGVPLIRIESPVIEIVEIYIAHKLMPNHPTGDALHAALASYHQCDFLLTWNCKNLANANKFKHLERINNQLGLSIPILATPVQLLGGDIDDDR